MLDRPLEPYHHWLVVLTVLKNMKVNGKDDIPYMKWKIKDMFETTNQIKIGFPNKRVFLHGHFPCAKWPNFSNPWPLKKLHQETWGNPPMAGDPELGNLTDFSASPVLTGKNPHSMCFYEDWTWVIKCPHWTSPNHDRYMVYNGYYKVMFNIPKMGPLPTPVSMRIETLPFQ